MDLPDSSPTISAEEIATIFNLSKQTVYEGAKRGEIPCIRVGRRVIFVRAAIQRMLEGAS